MSNGVVIFCTGCGVDVEARLTDGRERYPSRPDLYDVPFWHCDTCGAWVGCHHKTEHPTRPLGVLATVELINARKKIHRLLDPIWKSGKMERRHIYSHVGKKLGRPYHNGEIRTLDEARQIYKIVAQLHNEVNDLVLVGSDTNTDLHKSAQSDLTKGSSK